MLGIIPRPQAKTPTWIKGFLIISLIILGGSVFGFFALNWAQGSVRKKITQTQKELTALSTPQNKDLEKTVKVAQKQINIFPELSKQHIQPSAFFDLIKKTIHPDIALTEFLLEADKSQARLKGRAKNFQAVGEQILVLQKQPEIKKANLYSLSLDKKSQINFSLDLILAPQLLR